MGTVVAKACSRDVSSDCEKAIISSACAGSKDGSSDAASVAWTDVCDGGGKIGEVALSTFTTSGRASVTAVGDLVTEDGGLGVGGTT
jgi:hypothetical protein